MQFRKSTSLLLAILFLFSNLGLAFNVHYCHDEVASISVDYQFKEACVEKQKSCCAVAENHSECCSNKIVKIEKKSDNTLVNSFQFNLDFPVLITNYTLDFLFYKKSEVEVNELLDFYCDSNAPPFYKLYCQLVFYA